jgi:hypothetical protein
MHAGGNGNNNGGGGGSNYMGTCVGTSSLYATDTSYPGTPVGLAVANAAGGNGELTTLLPRLLYVSH